MAAFRQAARGRGWLDRDELLKEVSLVLGYQRLGPKIEESLRGHLRAAIRRRIIEPDGPTSSAPGPPRWPTTSPTNSGVVPLGHAEGRPLRP